MERRDFVSHLGMTLAFACAGGLAACTKNSADAPSPGGGPLLSADLTAELRNSGDYKIGGGVILIRVAAGNDASSFAALSSTCTHEGCTVSRFDSGSGRIECNAPCGHGSRYTVSGAVATGPATAALSQKTIAINGNMLTVS